MADLCIRERDGWHEVDGYQADEQLARYVGQGDYESAEAVLNEQGLYLAKPGTEGDEDHEGSVEFRLVRQPDDMLGWIDRLWFRCNSPVELVRFE